MKTKVIATKIDYHKLLLYGFIIALIFAYGNSCNSENTALTETKTAIKKADSLSNVAGAKILENEKLKEVLKDQKNQYVTIEKAIYKISNDYVKLSQLTNKKVKEVKSYTDKEKQAYFDNNYQKSLNPTIHLDSVVSETVIVDLEVGKGAVKSNVLLLEKTSLLENANNNLNSQIMNLSAQNENSLLAYENEKKASETLRNNAKDNIKQLRKERRNKTLWKLATIPSFFAGYYLAK